LAETWNTPLHSTSSASANASNYPYQPPPYKLLFKSRLLTCTRWVSQSDPKHISFPAHGSAVVTCFLFSRGRIISASDDHSIHYRPMTSALEGHEGGVWALAASRDILVSGSTDRTVRIWGLTTGRCTHVFGGHTSTV
jgi:F-box and WD-40 domain protein CDC4